MPLTPDEEYLAEHCYGYGSWSACYWFIGQEQGMGDEGVAERARAFRDTDDDRDGLSDCREFHLKIPDPRWHIPNPDPITGRVKHQSTWHYQISLLNGYFGKPNRPEIRRNYQSEELGRAEGETCILELRGLSSKSSKESKDQSKYIPTRAKKLQKLIEDRRPVFVVFYGIDDQAHWESISGCRLVLDTVTSHAGTMFGFLPHPNAWKEHKRKHGDWVKMGEQLQEKRQQLGLPDRCTD